MWTNDRQFESYSTVAYNLQTVQVEGYLHAPLIYIIGGLRPDEICHLYGLRVTRQSRIHTTVYDGSSPSPWLRR